MEEKQNSKKKKLSVVPEREKYVGFTELEDLTGMSASFFRKAQHKLGLPYYKCGGRIRFKLSEVDAWMRSRRIAG